VHLSKQNYKNSETLPIFDMSMDFLRIGADARAMIAPHDQVIALGLVRSWKVTCLLNSS
jgi:hypothetical protein